MEHSIDAGGITRHIARGRQQHPLLSEPTVARNWIWVVKSLWGSSDRLEANLMDTVVMSGGAVSGWYFTAKDGFVFKRSEKHCGMDQIREAFTALHDSFARKSSDTFCVTYSADGAPSVGGLNCHCECSWGGWVAGGRVAGGWVADSDGGGWGLGGL
jgi:hypothetical protein